MGTPQAAILIDICLENASSPPPAITFAADPLTIALGDAATLIWQTENTESVTIDNNIGAVALSGSVQVTPSETTTYTLTATGAGGTTTRSVTVTVIQPPTAAISASAHAINQGESVTLAWNSTNADACVIEPRLGAVPPNGTAEVFLVQTTTYTITATGPGGTATAVVEVVVHASNRPPVVILEPASITIARGQSATLNWNSTGAAAAHLDNGVGSVPTSGAVTITPQHTATYTLSVTGTGGSASAQAIVHVSGSPDEQPEASFGYLYNDLIPEDATVDFYDEKRFAILTGAVQDIDGQPIEGVLASIQNHPEYGTALTDDQGQFSLPVEGGGVMTVVYRKQDLITSSRQVNVPWNDIGISDTVILLAEDPVATTVTFDGNPDTVITHRSTPMTDEFGTRSATIVFTGDNQAYLNDENGSTVQILNTITTRATVFATPESMPAVLPPNSGFTYCVELTVDGAQRVKFSKPVMAWVENYLGFEVGEIVPVGYYDRDRGVWVPSDNGRVVRLLDTDADSAVDALDATADNQPDDLNGDGNFSDEVNGLNDPAKYAPGATFWRVAVTHFTPWDCNWPYGPPLDATAPNALAIPAADQQKQEQQDCKAEYNSFVEERSRIFHDDIPIPGTDMTLHYASSRVEGYKTVISVPASGETVPASLKRIIVKARIAGRTFEQTLDPLPEQKAEFFWDGLDYIGNEIHGLTTAHISFGFVYDGVYYSANDLLARSFAQAGSDITGVRAEQEVIIWKNSKIKMVRGNDTIAEGWTISSHHQLGQNVDSIYLFKGDASFVKPSISIIETVAGGNGTCGYSGDGGLALFAKLNAPSGMAVDATSNLYFSDMSNHRIRKVDTSGRITTVAGWGEIGFSGDGGPAVQAAIAYPDGLAIDSAGNLYFADRFNHRIRKVDTSGIITTLAGNSLNYSGGEYVFDNGGYSGDGGLAVQAQLNYPSDVIVDAFGNLFVVDQQNHRIRKIDTVGVITTVAGNGSSGYSGDGGPAIQARLSSALGGLAVDSFGNLFIADSGNRRVRKVNTSGIISTVAGNGSSGYSGDGGPALKAQLKSASDVFIDSAGNLYIADYGNHRIRKVDTSGVITTVAGNGSLGYSGNGGPAVKAQLNDPSELAIDNSGDLYIIAICQILKVTPVPATFANGMTAGDLAFAEESGVGHIMSTNGLHKSTIDLDTGIALYNFSYDQQDNLVSITDQFGNEVIIERTGGGAPTAIISPGGLRTAFAIDSANHLVRITYPDGSHYDFEYTSDGLLTAKIDPNGNHFSNSFDAQGRLVNISDDQGGLWQYSRAIESDGEIRIEKLSAESNLTTYLDHTDSTGAYKSIITDPTGAQTRYSRTADGLSAQKALSCGMSLSFLYDLDSEYGFEFVKQMTETTPLELAKKIVREKAYADTDADRLPDRITERTTVNGEATTLITDTRQSSKVVTSAAGRSVTALYDPATLLTKSLGIPQLHETSFGYDDRGRVISIDTSTRRSAFTYDSRGNLTSVTDPENHTTTYTHDPLGRVTAIQRPDGSSLAFTYDPTGNMTLLTNPVDVDHGFGFNQVNLPSSYQTPISGSYSYQYDKDRNLIQTTLPSGKKIHHIYMAGQLTQIQTPQGNIDLTYNCGSKIASMTKDEESIDYTYDGKLLTDVNLSGTLNQNLNLTYDDDFNVTAFTYAGSSAALNYDADGLLIGSDGFAITRNAQNGLPEYVLGNGLNVARTFNGYGELDGQAVTVNSQPILQWSLTRNNAGRIITKTETTEGETHTFEYGYDAMGRLLTVTRDGVRVEDYSYDLSGTRTSETNSLRDITSRSLSYSDEDHLLTAGDAVYSYDLDGFLAKKTEAGQVTTYTYSTRGELLQVILPDGRSISYQHDPVGRRIAKRIDGVIVEKYLWQGLPKLLAVYDGSDNLVQRFEYADDRMPVAMTQGASAYFLSYDQVGSLRVVTDGSGNVVKRIDYDTFGNIISDSNPAFSIPFGFAGGLHDRDTGLVRFGYRDYDPDTGCWTAKDPIGFAGGDTDLYGYVQNDPVDMIDPLGLFGDGYNAGGSSAGHSDFPGNDRFNFTKEDHGWSTPFNPFSTWRHFRDVSDVESDLAHAVANRDKDAFERLMHQGQDYFSHYSKDFRWYPQWDHGWGHADVGTMPDRDIEAWLKAESWTNKWLQIWDNPCP